MMLNPITRMLLAGVSLWMLTNAPVHAQDRSSKAPVEWVDSTGKHTVMARFRKLDGNAVILRLDDGRDLRIPLDRLSSDSAAQAKAMASGKWRSESTSTSDTSASASQPSPGSTPSQSASSSTSSGKFDNLDAKAFVDRVMDELKKNNAIVLWDAMPAGKQKQIEDLIASFARKLDSRTFDMVRKTRNTIFEIARKQQQFIINSSVLAIPSDQKSKLEKSYPALIGVLENYVPKEFFDGKRLQQGALRDLLNVWSTHLNASAQELAKTLPEGDPIRVQVMDYSGVPYAVDATSNNEAKLTMKIPAPNGSVQDVTMELVQSDGRWLPKDMVNGWDMAMSQANATVATLKGEEVHQMVSTALLFANAPLQGLKNAKSQEEFDKVLKDLMGAAQGMGMGPMGGMASGGLPPGGIPPGGLPGGFPPPGGQPPPADASNSGAGSASVEK